MTLKASTEKSRFYGYKAYDRYFYIQSSPFVVSPQYSVNPPTRSTNSYTALQIFTCYRVNLVIPPDFGGPDGLTISGLDYIAILMIVTNCKMVKNGSYYSLTNTT